MFSLHNLIYALEFLYSLFLIKTIYCHLSHFNKVKKVQ